MSFISWAASEFGMQHRLRMWNLGLTMLNIIDFNGKRVCRFSASKKLFIRAALFTKQISGVSVMVSGLSQQGLDSIAELKGIEVLFLQDCVRGANLDFLYQLDNLKDLTIDGVIGFLNLSKLARLERLSIDWAKWVNEIQLNTKINSLAIWKCKERDLKSISNFHSVTELSITQSTIENLDGIEGFYSLESLTLSLNKNLADLTKLKNLNVKKITLENSRKIIDYSFFNDLHSLEEIKIVNCAPIESLSIIKGIEGLKSCRIVGTKILDANLNELNYLDDHYYG